MEKIPFKKFIISLLFCGKDISGIADKLKSFNYFVSPASVSKIFDDIRSTIPESIAEHLNSGKIMNISDDKHVQWLNYYGVFEIYDHILRSAKNIDNPPNYFKWCDDCVWIHSYKDIMSVVNIFMYNDEPLDTISDVLIVKYRRKIGVDALKIYQDIFWDTTDMSAKDALKYCIPFQNNALIIRQMRVGSEIIMTNDASNDGSDVPFHFHDIEYIKWKIGYKVSAPRPRDFLEKVQTDSMNKFYEAMNMTQSIEIEEEEGHNEMGGYSSKKTNTRNVEEMKANQAKKWLDMYIKAKEHMPESGNGEDDFFKKMHELELEFTDCKEEIAMIDDLPDVMEDIKDDKASI